MSKAKLPTPLVRLVDERAPARSLEMWQNISLARASRGEGTIPKLRSANALRAACSVAALLMLAWVLNAAPAVEGALQRRDLRPLPTSLAPQDGFASLDLSDGSRITVARRARLDVLASSGRNVALALRYGRARFDVRPHGPRTWRIDCGELEVEVVGTAFTIERLPERVNVAVHRGAVLVRGAGVPDGVQRLNANEKLEVQATPPSASRPPKSASLPAGPRLEEPAPEPDESALAESARARAAAAGKPARAKVAPAPAIAQRADELRLWWREADDARAAGRFAAAVAPLKALAMHETDAARAALASFSLAKLYLSSLAQPSQAAQHLEHALTRGLREPIAEEARARLVEAHAAAGEVASACLAAESYVAHYPAGKRLSALTLSCVANRVPNRGEPSR